METAANELQKGNLSREEASEAVKGHLAEAKEKYKENDPHDVFRQNEIVIGNYTFEREGGAAGQWVISKVAQVRTAQCWCNRCFFKMHFTILSLSNAIIYWYKIILVIYLLNAYPKYVLFFR